MLAYRANPTSTKSTHEPVPIESAEQPKEDQGSISIVHLLNEKSINERTREGREGREGIESQWCICLFIFVHTLCFHYHASSLLSSSCDHATHHTFLDTSLPPHLPFSPPVLSPTTIYTRSSLVREESSKLV